MTTDILPLSTASERGDSIWLEATPARIAVSLWKRRELIREFALLELRARYRGSMLGGLWAVAQPLLMLAMYSFVFSYIFKPRWPAISDIPYALVLFCGLIVFNMFRDCASEAPGLIWARRSYVKRMAFPLEILPVALIVVAAAHMAVALLAFEAAALAWMGAPSPYALLLPVALVPLALTCLGAVWMLASLGVFVRDLSQAIQPLLQAAFFLTPVVYSAAALPEPLRFLLKLSPLAFAAEATRDVLLLGRGFDWDCWLFSTVVALGFACAGHAWFMATKSGFSDLV